MLRDVVISELTLIYDHMDRKGEKEWDCGVNDFFFFYFFHQTRTDGNVDD